jgi:D-alanyl-D-alanine carboxypeptidase/D-alanyl-D-alanine-endopeptidase (penicillin-binding protein 4)
MPARRLAALLLVLAAAGTGQAVAASPSSTMRMAILGALRSNGLAGGGTGVEVVDLATGQVMFRRNAWRELVPASNEKLFTTVTALATLRPGFRFTTRVTGMGRRQGATWRGDLYLVGGGDPTLTRAGIAQLAAQLRRSGIHRVTGRVLGDESIFDTIRYGPRWKPSFYGIESPPLSGLAFDRDVDARGHIVMSPARAAARALRRALVSRGVAVRFGHTGVGRSPTEAEQLAAVSSRQLWHITRFMDRNSDNFTAEMLLKAIGAYAGGGGSTAAGLVVERQVVQSFIAGDAALIYPVDGSGLSPANRATASALCHLLTAVAANPTVGPALDASLSVAGLNGTLEHRLRGFAGHLRVHGKTGTLDGVSSLSGYATTPTGHRYAFSILMNGRWLNEWKAHEAQDAIAQLLASMH